MLFHSVFYLSFISLICFKSSNAYPYYYEVMLSISGIRFRNLVGKVPTFFPEETSKKGKKKKKKTYSQKNKTLNNYIAVVRFPDPEKKPLQKRHCRRVWHSQLMCPLKINHGNRVTKTNTFLGNQSLMSYTNKISLQQFYNNQQLGEESPIYNVKNKPWRSKNHSRHTEMP